MVIDLAPHGVRHVRRKGTAGDELGTPRKDTRVCFTTIGPKIKASRTAENVIVSGDHKM